MLQLGTSQFIMKRIIDHLSSEDNLSDPESALVNGKPLCSHIFSIFCTLNSLLENIKLLFTALGLYIDLSKDELYLQFNGVVMKNVISGMLMIKYNRSLEIYF